MPTLVEIGPSNASQGHIVYIVYIYIVAYSIYIYIVVTTKEFSENKVLNIVNIEL